MHVPFLDFASYEFHVYSFPPLLIGIGILLLGLATVWRERGTSVSWIFLLLTSAAGIWLVSIAMIYASTAQQTALFWARVEHIGVLYIPAPLFHLAVTTMRTYQRYRKVVWIGWLLSTLFLLVGLTTNLLISDFYRYWWGYFPKYDLANVPFLIFFSVMLWISLRQYWIVYRTSIPGTTEYRRARALLIAFSIAYLGSMDYLPAYGIPYYPIGYIPVLVFMILSARAIWRYHLLDITPAFAANEIIHTMSEALLVLDGEGTVRVANRAARELFERDADHLVGKPVTTILESAVPTTPQAFLLKGGAIQTVESEYQRPSGEIRILSISASSMEVPAQGIVGTVCVIRDVTERKQAEVRIRREAERAEALLRVAARLNAQLDLDAVLHAVCEETARGLNVPIATVSLYDKQQDAFYLAASSGLPAEYQNRFQPLATGNGDNAEQATYAITVIADVQTEAPVGDVNVYVDLDVRTVIQVQMLREGELVGSVSICTVGQVRDFSRDELDLLQGLVDQAAQAITNAHLFEQAQRRLSQLRALRSIDAAITTSPDLNVTLDLLLEQIIIHLQVDAADILLLNTHHEALEYAAGRGFRSNNMEHLRVALHQSFAGRAVLERRTISEPDLRQGEHAARRKGLLAREQFISYYAVPLMAKDRIDAVLEIFHRSTLSPSPEWLNFMETLAGQAALAIDNAKLFAETKRQAAQLTTLNAIIAAAAGASDLAELLEIALEYVLQALDIKQGAIWVGGRHAVSGFARTLPSFENPLVQLAQRELPPIIIEDWQDVYDDALLDEMQPTMLGWNIQASLTVPVMAESRWVGGLSLAGSNARIWTDEEIALVKAVGQQLGAAAERLRLLAQIQMHAEQVQQIVDTIPDGVLLLDKDGCVALANPAAVEALKLLANADVNQALAEGWADRRLTRLGNQPVEALLVPQRRGVLAHEVTVEVPEPRLFEVMAQPMQAGTDRGGWVLVLRDVTVERQIKERAQQQDRLAAVGQLAAGIAHDFNNIMLVIALYAQMVQRTTELPAKAQDRLDTIRRQAVHATNLIQQILDFSRRSVMERRPIALLPFLKEFLQLLQRALPENIHIEFRCEEGEYMVHADATRLQQVLMNLAVNARDAMPRGGELSIAIDALTIEPEAKPPMPELSAGSWLILTVSDTGTGIPPKVLPHLFEPFFTTKEPGQGTGLGLAQVYGIVKQHGGHIGVESEVGRGTTFTIYLPAMTLTEEMLPLGDGSTAMATGSETILVAEDDEAAREAIQSILKSQGYQVLEAPNGRVALELFAEHRDEVNLVLSDMVMPEMGSVQLYEALKAQAPNLKMIVITGYPLEDDGKALLEQGILSWLPKPFSAEQIVNKVREALEAE